MYALFTSVYLCILIFYALNDEIANFEKADEICSRTSVPDEFSGIFLHPSTFSIFIEDLHN